MARIHFHHVLDLQQQLLQLPNDLAVPTISPCTIIIRFARNTIWRERMAAIAVSRTRQVARPV